ncbi:MAG: hypothetical protein L0Y36_00760 [Planctomycetales bacterium]|nr:hypothetical protein [Planctomycetales bacterium]
MRNELLSIFIVFSLATIGYGDYSIPWHTIDGGGGTSSGGTYQLTGTIGQPNAGYHGGGPYELLGGFWVGGPLCIVDLEDFAQFASYWLEVSCDAGNDYCGGADLNHLDDVNLDDLTLLAVEWLKVCPYNWPLK